MIDPNQPAFPFFSPESGTNYGLTVRAELAARNLAAILSNPAFKDLNIDIAVSAALGGADELIERLNEDEEEDRKNAKHPPAYDEFDHGMSQGH